MISSRTRATHEHDCPEFVPALLEVLFDRIGISLHGDARYVDAKFPTEGDEQATYRNSLFAIRPFIEDDNRVPHPANFEHFATGLQIQFYKRLYKSVRSNLKIDSATRFHAMISECLASIPDDHKTGEPAPDLVGRVQHHELARPGNPQQPNHNTLRLSVVDSAGRPHDLIAFGQVSKQLLKVIETKSADPIGFRISRVAQRHHRHRRPVVDHVILPDSLKSPFED